MKKNCLLLAFYLTILTDSFSQNCNIPVTPGTIQYHNEGIGVGGTIVAGLYIAYSITPVANADYYEWKMTECSGAYLSKTTTVPHLNISLISYNLETVSIAVKAVNSCGSSAFKTIQTLPPPPRPSQINVTSSNGVYSLTTYSENANSYVWTTSNGSFIGSTNGRTVQFVPSESRCSFTVEVKAKAISFLTPCISSLSPSRTFTKNIPKPATPSTIQSHDSGIGMGAVAGALFAGYSISPVSNAKYYEWQTVGCNGTSGIITTNVPYLNIHVSTNLETVTVSVRAVNSCGKSTFRSIQTLPPPSRPSSISMSISNGIYSLTTYSANANSYVWTTIDGSFIGSTYGRTVKFTPANGKSSFSVSVKAKKKSLLASCNIESFSASRTFTQSRPKPATPRNITYITKGRFIRYSTEAMTYAEEYEWKILNSNGTSWYQTTSTPVININSTTHLDAVSIAVRAYNSCGTSNFRVHRILKLYKPKLSSKSIINNSNSITSDPFPNPASNKFFANTSTFNSVQILNEIGSVKLEQHNLKKYTLIELDVSKLREGIYYIKFTGTNETKMSRLMINK